MLGGERGPALGRDFQSIGWKCACRLALKITDSDLSFRLLLTGLCPGLSSRFLLVTQLVTGLLNRCQK